MNSTTDWEKGLGGGSRYFLVLVISPFSLLCLCICLSSLMMVVMMMMATAWYSMRFIALNKPRRSFIFYCMVSAVNHSFLVIEWGGGGARPPPRSYTNASV